MRPSEPTADAIDRLVDRVFAPTVPRAVERLAEGVSTWVYRVQRGTETFFLRVLPEDDATFAPEARAHDLLRAAGVLVPEIVYYEPHDPLLGRSVLVTTAIAGAPVSRLPVGPTTGQVLRTAGQHLALLNQVPVAGFGWVRRDRPYMSRLVAEHPSARAFIGEYLDQDLAALAGTVLDQAQVERVRALVREHQAGQDSDQAWLAHGDFDVTHIFQRDGRFTGIIDLGEIRGSDPWYDLGHVHLHDGETLPVPVLAWLLEGYQTVTPLPPDHPRHLSFASLCIAIRALGRHLARGRPLDQRRHTVAALRRDLQALTINRYWAG